MTETITAKQYRKRGRRSKYGNKKIEMDGITFDSRAEARYYKELLLRKQANDILFFRLQPRYRLQEGFEKDDVKFRPIDYVADFEIHHTEVSVLSFFNAN